jgi:hypothetical protein
VLFRLHGVVVVAALGVALAAPAARADGLCIEDTQIEPDLGRTLDRLVTTAVVTVRSPGRCQADGARLVGRFSRLDPVLFTLHTRQGEKFSRAVPWLTRPDAALVRLRAQGRMSAFSVLVEGLLAEQRIAAGKSGRESQAASAPAVRAPAPAAAERTPSARPAPAATEPTPSTRPVPARAQERPGVAQQPEQAPAAPRTGDAPATDEPEPPPSATVADVPAEAPAAEPATAEPAGEPAAAEPGTGVAVGEPAAVEPGAGEPAAAVPAPGATAGPAAAGTAPAVSPSPPPAVQPPIEGAAPSRPAAQRVTVPMSGQDSAERARSDRPDAATAVQVQERPGTRTWPSPEALVAARMRWPDMLGVEVGAGVAWRSLLARASYQPPVRWDLEGRPIDVAGMALTAGYRPAAYRRGAWRIGPSLAVILERVTVQRADLQDAAVHPYWDPGVAVGGAITRDIAGVLRMTVHVEASRSFGRTVRVPDGPEAAFNRLGARAALSFAWLP